MENITCQFDISTSNYVCSIPYIEPISYNGENSYVLNYWTDGEILICIVLFFILILQIFKFGFEFFYPKIVEVKKWRK